MNTYNLLLLRYVVCLNFSEIYEITCTKNLNYFICLRYMRLPREQLTLLRLRYVSASYTSLVRPKSDIFRTLPVPTKTFLAARSRCTSWKEKCRASSNTKHTLVSGLWGIYYVFPTLWTQGWLGLIFFF